MKPIDQRGQGRERPLKRTPLVHAELPAVGQTSAATQSLKLATVFRPMREAERTNWARRSCKRITQVRTQHACTQLVAMFAARRRHGEKVLTVSCRPDLKNKTARRVDLRRAVSL